MGFLDNLLPTMAHLGDLTYWLAFLVALVESLTFVGAFVPGATLVIVSGFAAAQGIIDVGDLIWFVAVGAIIGDGISYHLGTKGARFFKQENKLLKLSHLEKGQMFFKKHGAKSIFLGRFVGPLRAIVPFIAGASRMDLRVFIFWNVFSGVVWAVSHVLLGYFFGNTYKSIEIWITRAGALTLVLVVLGLIIWYAIKHSKPIIEFGRSLWSSILEAFKKNKNIQHLLQKYPDVFRFLGQRIKKDKFSGLPLTLLIIVFGFFLFTFLGIIQDVVSSDPIVKLDVEVARYLAARRDTYLTGFFLFITLGGKWVAVSIIGILVSTYFYLQNQKRNILPLLLTLPGTAISVALIKILIHRARPGVDIAYYIEKSLSFPSGHAAISVALYGYIAYFFISRSFSWKRKTNIFFTATMIIFLIGLSRMYLGVHYLSDVLGGYVLGALWLIIGIALTELIRKKEQ